MSASRRGTPRAFGRGRRIATARAAGVMQVTRNDPKLDLGGGPAPVTEPGFPASILLVKSAETAQTRLP